jgi:hypothetical protein
MLIPLPGKRFLLVSLLQPEEYLGTFKTNPFLTKEFNMVKKMEIAEKEYTQKEVLFILGNGLNDYQELLDQYLPQGPGRNDIMTKLGQMNTQIEEVIKIAKPEPTAEAEDEVKTT